MKTLISIGLIVGILQFVCSCQNENLELKGKIVDNYTKEGIPSREVIVQVLVENEKELLPVYNGEFSTDSLGEFTYSLKKGKSEYLYNFSLIGDSVYSYKNVKIGLSELNKFGRFLTFELERLADLTITLESKSSNSMNESIFLSWRSDGKEGKFLYPYKVFDHGSASSNQTLKWTGGNVKSEIRTMVFADKPTIVRWEIFRYGKVRQVTDTVLCKRDVDNYISFIF